MFLDHQTLAKVYFKRRTNQSIKANSNYGNNASTYGLWDGVGVNKTYDYQLLICDTSFYGGFFVSGYTNCYKQCGQWGGDLVSPYFRTASTNSGYSGVAFNTNGHRPVNKRPISVGLRWDIYGLSFIIPFLSVSYLNMSITYYSYLSLSRLCTATSEQLFVFGATFCCTNNLEQFLPYCAIFEQIIALEHISSTKKSTIS